MMDSESSLVAESDLQLGIHVIFILEGYMTYPDKSSLALEVKVLDGELVSQRHLAKTSIERREDQRYKSTVLKEGLGISYCVVVKDCCGQEVGGGRWEEKKPQGESWRWRGKWWGDLRETRSSLT
jgi:hypothetical protein